MITLLKLLFEKPVPKQIEKCKSIKDHKWTYNVDSETGEVSRKWCRFKCEECGYSFEHKREDLGLMLYGDDWWDGVGNQDEAILRFGR